MKAEELQVGDWVETLNGNKRIKKVSNKAVWYEGEEGGHLRTCIAFDVSPVPITPDILEKNGFKSKVKEFGRTGWNWGNELIHAFVFKHDDGRYVILCENKCEGIYDAFIDSVHELQHALRLCKIGKEIEL